MILDARSDEYANITYMVDHTQGFNVYINFHPFIEVCVCVFESVCVCVCA